MVYHKPNVGFVDAHAKGDRGNDHIGLLHQEFVLVGLPGFRVKSGMIGQGFDAINLESIGKLFHFLPAQAINDPRFALVIFYVPDDIVDHVFGFWPDLVIEVRPVERRHEHRCGEDLQVFLYVVLHFWRSRCRECHHGHLLSDGIDDGPEPPVFGPKVVTPFRYAVCLVDGIEGDVDTFEEFYIVFLRERFRGNIQELRLLIDQVLLYLVQFNLRK